MLPLVVLVAALQAGDVARAAATAGLTVAPAVEWDERRAGNLLAAQPGPTTTSPVPTCPPHKYHFNINYLLDFALDPTTLSCSPDKLPAGRSLAGMHHKYLQCCGGQEGNSGVSRRSDAPLTTHWCPDSPLSPCILAQQAGRFCSPPVKTLNITPSRDPLVL